MGCCRVDGERPWPKCLGRGRTNPCSGESRSRPRTGSVGEPPQCGKPLNRRGRIAPYRVVAMRLSARPASRQHCDLAGRSGVARGLWSQRCNSLRERQGMAAAEAVARAGNDDHLVLEVTHFTIVQLKPSGLFQTNPPSHYKPVEREGCTTDRWWAGTPKGCRLRRGDPCGRPRRAATRAFAGTGRHKGVPYGRWAFFGVWWPLHQGFVVHANVSLRAGG